MRRFGFTTIECNADNADKGAADVASLRDPGRHIAVLDEQASFAQIGLSPSALNCRLMILVSWIT